METFSLAGEGYRFALLITRGGGEGRGGRTFSFRGVFRRTPMHRDRAHASSRLGEHDRSSARSDGAKRSGVERRASAREKVVEEEAYVTLAKTHTVTRVSYDIMLCKT